MTWLARLGIFVLGWAVSLGALLFDSRIGDLHRLEALILTGPVVSVWLIVDAIRSRGSRSGRSRDSPK